MFKENIEEMWMEIKEFIIKYIKDIGEGKIKEIHTDVEIETYGINSIQFISLIVLLEDRYQIVFDDDEIIPSLMNTVEKITNAVMNYIQEEKNIIKHNILEV